MTKSSKLVADIIISSEAPAAPAAASRPYALTVFGPTTLAMQELAAHVRNGYVPDINTPIQVFGSAGTISIVLILGNPDQAYIDRAAVTTADAVAMEEARYSRDVQLAAERLVAANTKAAADAKRAALLAEQKATMAALEKQLAAEAALEAVAVSK